MDDFGTDVFIIAEIIAFVERVASAEFAAERVPDELHELNALFRVVTIGAAGVGIEILAHFGIAHVIGVRGQIDEGAGEDVLDDLAQLAIQVVGSDAIGQARFDVGRDIAGVQGVTLRPWLPKAPRSCCDKKALRRRRLGRRGNPWSPWIRCLEKEAADKVELDGQARAAVEHEARQESGTREEVVDLVDVTVGEHIFVRHEDFVEDNDGIVFVQPAGERVIVGLPMAVAIYS